MKADLNIFVPLLKKLSRKRKRRSESKCLDATKNEPSYEIRWLSGLSFEKRMSSVGDWCLGNIILMKPALYREQKRSKALAFP